MNLKSFIFLIIFGFTVSLPDQYYQHSAVAKKKAEINASLGNVKNKTFEKSINKTSKINQIESDFIQTSARSNNLISALFPFNIPGPLIHIIPYSIQQQTFTPSGQIITENLIGGIPFNCLNKPTGHFRDSFFCDVFHACVYGQQRKTYSCPYVGELLYFDDYTKKCEFIRNNPYGCLQNNFLNVF
ncbi:unnamed protein product [Brachionus calyciflorus]|uniref:Chitin-binding type-2 domain-containing protein n=1 Tax=Brachionus calyciflorus TaxID=104777 RepID=A0A813V0N5_9BILA|nr:unnamed protein product [Brachionus calyciflorus]